MITENLEAELKSLGFYPQTDWALKRVSESSLGVITVHRYNGKYLMIDLDNGYNLFRKITLNEAATLNIIKSLLKIVLYEDQLLFLKSLP